MILGFSGSFYGQVMVELIVAFGAALLVGNVVAVLRRRNTPEPATGDGTTLARAPVLRSALFAVVGLLMVLWGVATLVRG